MLFVNDLKPLMMVALGLMMVALGITVMNSFVSYTVALGLS